MELKKIETDSIYGYGIYGYEFHGTNKEWLKYKLDNNLKIATLANLNKRETIIKIGILDSVPYQNSKGAF